MKVNKRGFTLIEILAVIVILAVLAVITIPIVMGIIEETRKDRFLENVKSVVASVEQYNSEHDMKAIGQYVVNQTDIQYIEDREFDTKMIPVKGEFDGIQIDASTSKFASCKFYQYLGGVARYISKNISFDDNLRPTCNIETSGSGVSLEDLDENIIISKSNVPESGEVTRTVRYNFSSISNITVNEDLAKGKRFGICFNDLSDGRITMEKFYLSNGDVLTDSDMLEYIRNKGAIFDISMKYSY